MSMQEFLAGVGFFSLLVGSGVGGIWTIVTAVDQWDKYRHLCLQVERHANWLQQLDSRLEDAEKDGTDGAHK